MQTGRELPGFRKKSFVLPYGGGEIWCEHLDGMYECHDLVIEKLEEDKKAFLKPSMTSLFCVNVDETEVTADIIEKIADILLHSDKMMRKVCFVGTGWSTRMRLKKALRSGKFLLEFINDFEKAKEWLVS